MNKLALTAIAEDSKVIAEKKAEVAELEKQIETEQVPPRRILYLHPDSCTLFCERAQSLKHRLPTTMVPGLKRTSCARTHAHRATMKP